jgi:DNA-binding HxlR family transcriptional regulator
MAEPTPLRSSCPIASALDLLGDRWTLVVLRDILLAQKHSFSALCTAEGISSSILADRLNRLVGAGVLEVRPDADDGRRRTYVPTERGVALIPVLLELLIWGFEHTAGTAKADVVAAALKDRRTLTTQLQKAARASMRCRRA